VSNYCNFIAQGVSFFVTFKRKKNVYLIGTITNFKKTCFLDAVTEYKSYR
jgi:hypothetical protein